MSNNTVLDALEVIEAQLDELDLKRGVLFNSLPASTYELSKNILTVYKYSLLYLVHKNKIALDDHIDKWKRYEKGFKLSDHYKVANAYLLATGKAPLNYTQAAFKSDDRIINKKRSAQLG